jgi:hypothetical protein
MKTKLFVILFLAASIIPTFIYAQFTQQGPKIIGSGGDASSAQGSSVAISSDGNTAVEGGIYDNNAAGAVWIFTRSGGVWTQQGPKLVGTGAVGSFVYQGYSVAISADGNTVIEGGYEDNNRMGAAWVFTRSGGVWTQQGPKLVGAGSVGDNVYQGGSVAISPDGNTVFDGGPGDNGGNNGLGAFWIFTRTGNTWSQLGNKLSVSDGNGQPNLGRSLAISADGNNLIVGGPNDSGGLGAAWVFTRSGNSWTQQGGKLFGSGSYDPANEGYSVAISANGNTAVFGGPYDFASEGAVWVFIRNGNSWSQQGPILYPILSLSPIKAGASVAITPDGNTFLVSGPGDSGSIGTVWEYTRNGAVWTKQNQKIVGSGRVGASRQGWQISLSSEGTLIDGGPYDDNGTGAIWFFNNPTIGITPISTLVPAAFSLSQNYPNPFNPNTKFKFQISKLSDTKISVFDVLGREVEILVDKQLQPGTYEVDWNASNYPSGVYFYKLTSVDYSETKKMVLIK